MGYAFFKKVECLCMQGLQISEWSFKEAISGWKIIQYFSFRHKLQRFDAGLYAAPLSIILHLIVYCLPSSFIFQTNLLSVVLVICSCSYVDRCRTVLVMSDIKARLTSRVVPPYTSYTGHTVAAAAAW